VERLAQPVHATMTTYPQNHVRRNAASGVRDVLMYLLSTPGFAAIRQ